MKYYRTRIDNLDKRFLDNRLYLDDLFKVDENGKEYVYDEGEWKPTFYATKDLFKSLGNIYTVIDISEKEVDKIIMMEELKK